ncbi:MAG: hypothetical protein MH252_20500 [Thermosynechococcaceae cyanobacterium MS004]|nr:hypothetical protein [Thermosynechococcaceae cyanobacterium MS004]
MHLSNVTTEPVFIEPIAVDLKQIIEHGESPTAVILAISVFAAVLLNSLAKLVDVIGIVLKLKNLSKKSDE